MALLTYKRSNAHWLKITWHVSFEFEVLDDFQILCAEMRILGILCANQNLSSKISLVMLYWLHWLLGHFRDKVVVVGPRSSWKLAKVAPYRICKLQNHLHLPKSPLEKGVLEKINEEEESCSKEEEPHKFWIPRNLRKLNPNGPFLAIFKHCEALHFLWGVE